MRRTVWGVLGVFALAAVALTLAAAPPQAGAGGQAAAKPDFSITASYIEACSCDLFCPCYFNDHAEEHFCKFNNVLRVDKGYYKDTKLDGVRVWLAGDLGPEWGKGKADWLVVTFDPSVTKAQQAAMTDILFQLYPLKWDVKGVDTATIYWKVDAKSGVATARLGKGNAKGEVVLERFAANNNDPGKEVVIHNLKYWGSQSNTGFRMWKSKHNYYEGHAEKTEMSGKNGFLITITFSGQAKSAAAD
jgi:uncharacterized protein DUF1326